MLKQTATCRKLLLNAKSATKSLNNVNAIPSIATAKRGTARNSQRKFTTSLKTLDNLQTASFDKNATAMSFGVNSRFKENDVIEGWRLKKIRHIPEFSVTTYELEHERTGASYVHVAAPKDKNNTFAITFKTIPFSSSGEAHILEHTTLCGSEKFPVRDMFFNMYSRSLNTYMNAWTGPDFTSYPFATQNEKDYYNLMEVYLDACFFPQLKESHFLQEGHRLEFDKLDDPSSDLKIKGVVYNEMKGAMGDPSQYFSRFLFSALLPETCYQYNSGGDPQEIPQLTHQQLKNFHDTYYHPSNSLFFSYGDLPFEKHLKFINEKALNKFSKLDTSKIHVGTVQRFTEPKRITIQGPPDSMVADPSAQTKFAISFLTNSRKDSYESFAMSFLCSLLLDEPRGPFYKALIQSGLAPDFAPSTGFDSSISETSFTVGVQGIPEEDTNLIEETIMQVFDHTAREGIEKELIDSALHSLEISIKKISPNFGINLVSNIASEWMHGTGNAGVALSVNDKLDKLKQELAAGTFFKDRIEKYFLNNPHKVILTMNPDEQYVAKQAQEEAALIQNKKSALKEADLSKIVASSVSLKQSQEQEPDKSCLPTVHVSDISRTNPEKIELAKTSHKGHNMFYNERVTNGLVYVTVMTKLDMSKIPRHLQPYLPLLASLLTKMGARDMNHEKLAEQIELHTGGIRSSFVLLPEFSATEVSQNFTLALTMTSYCLERNLEKMVDLLTALYTDPRLTSDLQFLKAQVDQAAISSTSDIMDHGNTFARLLAASSLTHYDSFSELFSGISLIQLLNQLSSEANTEQIAQNLQSLAKLVLAKQNVQVLITSEPSVSNKAHNEVARQLLESVDTLPVAPVAEESTGAFQPAYQKAFVAIPSSVNFSGECFTTAPFLHKDSCTLRVASALINSNYLHKEIREKGGAYGTSASQAMNGVFSFTSYRDPSTTRTIQAYRNVANWVQRDGSFSNAELDEAKLQLFQDLDAPQAPHEKAYNLFVYGVTEEIRQQRRTHFLDTSKQDIQQAVSQYLTIPEEKRSTVIIGSKELITDEISSSWAVRHLNTKVAANEEEEEEEVEEDAKI